MSPHILAQEVVTKVKDDVPDWTKYDLNNDGWVDRFLILHCTKPQEDGGGASSRIWSHFSSIEEVVDLPNDMKISHYTIASQYSSNNFGTIMHEMYHQLGAADLYAVHDSTVNQDWRELVNGISWQAEIGMVTVHGLLFPQVQALNYWRTATSRN